MVAMAMSCVDIDPQRTVTLVVPRREALLANGFNDTAGMPADIDMIISKISHISCFYSSLPKGDFKFVLIIFLSVPNADRKLSINGHRAKHQ